ncbi:hypothetical protein IVA98_05700 [Bradyrhizobium sp. 160]|nr:hypothetical protein [Bradyrhizobium sp. 160]MCK1622747.1 hypothetical protein [Bradyrhizobium sp. 160]
MLQSKFEKLRQEEPSRFYALPKDGALVEVTLDPEWLAPLKFARHRDGV